MAEPWFDAMRYAWIPGTVLGCLGGLWGALAGACAPRGRAKSFVIGLGAALLGSGVLCLILGIVAWFSSQPYGVWYGLGLTGLIVPIVVGVNLPNILRVYRAAEERKLSAGDL